MKSRVPKGWDSLSKRDKEAINQYCLEILRSQEEKDVRIILDLYMKMMCATLHDAFGFGEKRLTYFLGQHYMLFHRQRSMASSGEQLQYLNKRMDEIFRKDGFPQQFIDGMLGEVEESSDKDKGDLL